MNGIQYIKGNDGEQRYAVVDLKQWNELFKFFLEEVEDTMAYDEEVGFTEEQGELINSIKKQLGTSDLSFTNSKRRNGFLSNGKKKASLEDKKTAL